MPAYAHTFEYPDGSPAPESEWEPLFTPFGDGPDDCQKQNCEKCRLLDRKHGHLNKVAYWCAKFAGEMFPPGSEESKRAADWGYLAGLWHDLGKFAPEWQKYLAAKIDIHASDSAARMDHSTAGAMFANELKPMGELLAYLIAGHHAGLACGTDLFNDRLVNRKIADWRPAAEAAGVPLSLPIPLPPLKRIDASSTDLAFMVRYFYSCLVDADFLATEAFMNPRQGGKRSVWPNDLLDRMVGALEEYFETRFGQSEPTSVNRQREEVRQACAAAAEERVGFFSLTVPTGGGKTLSSLLFALKHARKHRLRRIIYVIPFTSIIQQNADVFRSVFADLSKEIGQEIVLEHHSKFEPAEERENSRNRLAAENWDAPLIVTTNVRFFESLFANRSSECRKLHRTASSVLIFDEVQALPIDLLAPILSGLRSLVKDFQTSAVLCTATQPALERRDDFTVGIPKEEIVPIIPDEKMLFDVLKRVEPQNLGKLEDSELIDHLLGHAEDGCLLIVNTTKAAQQYYEKLNEEVRAFHLSARMCSAHIISVLDQVRNLREAGEPAVLVSTQLIEAGVDISFPVVYRAECGLDSFAQAAGRCNRNGELLDGEGRPVYGKAFIFQPVEHPIPRGLSDLVFAANITRNQVLPNFSESEILSSEAIRLFFEHAIWQAKPRTNSWDKPGIVSGDSPCFGARTPTRVYDYQRAARDFRLIPSVTHPVLIPWGEVGKKLADEIRELDIQKRKPNREHFRRAQQFSVQVYANEWYPLQSRISLHCDEVFAILTHPENDYHPETGLKRPDTSDNPNAFFL